MFIFAFYIVFAFLAFDKTPIEVGGAEAVLPIKFCQRLYRTAEDSV